MLQPRIIRDSLQYQQNLLRRRLFQCLIYFNRILRRRQQLDGTDLKQIPCSVPYQTNSGKRNWEKAAVSKLFVRNDLYNVYEITSMWTIAVMATLR